MQEPVKSDTLRKKTAKLARMERSLYQAVFLFLAFFILPAIAASEETSIVSAGELAESIARIEGSIVRLQELANQTQQSSPLDAEALEFRLDQRIIRLMNDVTRLVRHAVALPSDNPDRNALEERLAEDLADTDQLLFQRMEALQARYALNREKSQTAGEPDKFALQAYVHGLENLRMGYIAALVNLIESRDLLGLPNEDIRQKVEPMLYREAEKTSARIELFRVTLGEMKAKLAKDTTNTAMLSVTNQMQLERAVEIGRLEALLKYMTQLDIDTVLYRSVLLRESSGVSLRLLDREAIGRVLEDSWEATRGAAAKNLPEMLFKLFIFVLILFAFRALSHLTGRLVRSALNRSSADLSTLLKDILVSGSGAMVMLLGILVALSQVGVSLGPALAGLGVAGFIIGFALQDTLGNFAAGGMILIYRPYDVDDFVEVAGVSGLVKKMNLVSTTINTFDNQTLVLPNSKIWGDVIKNVTAQKTRRVDLVFGISYSDDIDKAERVLREIVESHDKVLPEPAPNIRLHTLGDSSVDFIVRPWTKTVDYWEVYWDITREVKVRFDRDGISIPFPQRDIHVHRQES